MGVKLTLWLCERARDFHIKTLSTNFMGPLFIEFSFFFKRASRKNFWMRMKFLTHALSIRLSVFEKKKNIFSRPFYIYEAPTISYAICILGHINNQTTISLIMSFKVSESLFCVHERRVKIEKNISKRKKKTPTRKREIRQSLL